MERILRLGRLHALLAVLALGTGACVGGQSPEERARETAEEISKAQPDVEATALAQPVDQAVVAEAQQQLTILKEYQGEINGKLDSVTANAIEAFQRSAGISDDGILDSRTREKLAAAARAAGTPSAP